MFYDGTYKEEDLDLAIDDIQSVESLENDRFLITDANNLINYLDFKQRNFVTFEKPVNSYGYKINTGGDRLFFFIDRDLYDFGFNDLTGNSQQLAVEKNKVADKVDAVSFGFAGQVYILSGGVAYRTDDHFTAKEPLNLSLSSYKNLFFINGRDYGYLILRTMEDQRLLYIVDKKGRYKLLSEDIIGNPFVNGFDQLLYAQAGGEIYYYDANLKEKVKVMILSRPFEILGWFSDEGHFVFKEKDMIKLGDVFNGNIYNLLDADGLTKIFVLSKNIFYIKDNKAFALNWRSLL
jgi:hypothetical protein